MTQDYSSKTHEELTKIAKERGVENVEAYRKADLRKLLKAKDDGDVEAEAEVVKEVLERLEKVRAAKAPADSIAAKVADAAAKSAGVPMASLPANDLSKLKQGRGVDEAKARVVVEEQAKAPPVPRVDFSASDGSSIVEQIKARAAAARSAPPPRPRSSAIADALRIAPPSDPSDVPTHDVYEVQADGQYFSRHGVYKLAKGSLVSATTHDMDAVRRAGVQLAKIDPSKTKVQWSELGHPVALETTAKE